MPMPFRSKAGRGAARKFNSQARRVKLANVGIRPMRGGIRL